MNKRKYILFIKILLTILFIFCSNFETLSETLDKNYFTELKIERLLAKKYCDSINENLFKGLDKESVLQYEYFFSSINPKDIIDKNKFIKDFSSEVQSICSYKLSELNKKEFEYFIEKNDTK